MRRVLVLWDVESRAVSVVDGCRLGGEPFAPEEPVELVVVVAAALQSAGAIPSPTTIRECFRGFLGRPPSGVELEIALTANVPEAADEALTRLAREASREALAGQYDGIAVLSHDDGVRDLGRPAKRESAFDVRRAGGGVIGKLVRRLHVRGWLSNSASAGAARAWHPSSPTIPALEAGATMLKAAGAPRSAQPPEIARLATERPELLGWLSLTQACVSGVGRLSEYLDGKSWPSGPPAGAWDVDWPHEPVPSSFEAIAVEPAPAGRGSVRLIRTNGDGHEALTRLTKLPLWTLDRALANGPISLSRGTLDAAEILRLLGPAAHPDLRATIRVVRQGDSFRLSMESPRPEQTWWFWPGQNSRESTCKPPLNGLPFLGGSFTVMAIPVARAAGVGFKADLQGRTVLTVSLPRGASHGYVQRAEASIGGDVRELLVWVPMHARKLRGTTALKVRPIQDLDPKVLGRDDRLRDFPIVVPVAAYASGDWTVRSSAAGASACR